MNGAITRVYSLAKDGKTKLPDKNGHFTVKEFRCKDGSDPVFVSEALIQILEQIRRHFGKPVYLEKHSAYRTPPHNKAVGGSTYSYHMYGMAADISVKGVKPETVAAYAHDLLGESGGVGLYKTYIHIDVREKKYRFDKRSGKEIAVSGF